MANMMSVDCSWYQNIEKSNYDVAVKTTCDMSLLSNEFAWVDETTQHEGASDQMESQFRMRKTEAYCKEVDAFNKNLNNGRTCSQHNQCISGNCQDQVCTGLKLGEHCNKHTDCNAAMFCNQAKQWPFYSTCSKLSTSYQDCNSDYECAAYTYCWYATAALYRDKKLQCLPMYSQSELVAWVGEDIDNPTFEEQRKNGLYCKSGLAFPVKPEKEGDPLNVGKCAEVDNVQFDGKKIDFPY